MPYKKKPYTKKPRRKKPMRRKKAYPSTTVQRGITSHSQIVKMRYTDAVSLNPGTGTPAYDTWSATSLYDPYPGTGGHQPLGFDQWMTFYNHYMVLGAKLTCYSTTTDSANFGPTYTVVNLEPSAVGISTDINTIIEQDTASYKLLQSSPGGIKQTVVKSFYSPRKFFGLRNPRDEHDLRGGQLSSPVENAYWNVSIVAQNPSNDPAAVVCRVVIDYVVLLTERNPITGS